jgi:hypothetical protein
MELEERKMKRLMTICLVCLFAGAIVPAADATVSIAVSGTSAKGVHVSFEAQFTIADDILTLVLKNTSPVASENPDDTLGSFYFDIVNGSSVRPELTLTDARGDLYNGVVGGPDTLIESNADLLISGERGWIYRDDMDASQLPYLRFGVGTVGNSAWSPNNFPAMDGIQSAIFTGNIESESLDKGLNLVKDQATFTFSGITGFTEADISPQVVFGLGTKPDSFLVPEPATLILLGLSSLFFSKVRRVV